MLGAWMMMPKMVDDVMMMLMMMIRMGGERMGDGRGQGGGVREQLGLEQEQEQVVVGLSEEWTEWWRCLWTPCSPVGLIV